MAGQDAQQLEQIVAEVVRRMLHDGPLPVVAADSGAQTPVDRPPAGARRRDDDAPRPGSTRWRQRQAAPEPEASAVAREPVPQRSPLPGLQRLASAEALHPLVGATPARIGIGRAGLRYPTGIYLTLRADHAVAKDAVASTPTPGFVAGLGALELHTKAKDLETFLLHPEQGRTLDDASLLRLRNEGTAGVDVQIVLADGLSAWAAERNQGLLAELERALGAAGFSYGKPIWVHRARIAVADQIGVELRAKATLICLGERPGLGTGDSLSIYLAWNPKIGQDNAEKNCISNVRPAGFSVAAAAQQAAEILRRAREIGQGGLAIGKV